MTEKVLVDKIVVEGLKRFKDAMPLPAVIKDYIDRLGPFEIEDEFHKTPGQLRADLSRAFQERDDYYAQLHTLAPAYDYQHAKLISANELIDELYQVIESLPHTDEDGFCIECIGLRNHAPDCTLDEVLKKAKAMKK